MWPPPGFATGAPRSAARGGDPLLDRFMPDYDVCERHEIAIAAPADVTFEAAKQMELEGSPLVHAIFKARELIMGAKADATRDRAASSSR